jgi:hypothetical protein
MDNAKISNHLDKIVKLAGAQSLVSMIVDAEGEVQLVSRGDIPIPDMQKMSDELANLVNVLRAAKFVNAEKQSLKDAMA